MGIFSKLFSPQKTLIGTIPAAAGIKPDNIVGTMAHGKGLIALTTHPHVSGYGRLAIATFTTPGAFIKGKWYFGESDGNCYIEWPPLPGETQETTQVTPVSDFTFAPEFLPSGFKQTPTASKKEKQADPLEEGFRKICRLVEDENYQNSLLEPPIWDLVLSGEAVDEIVSAEGRFGFSPGNPIPVNGPIGELSYLSRLRNENGERLFFHRLASIDVIDVYEAVSWSGNDWYLLYFDMYHPRRSRKVLAGFSFSADLAQFTGFHAYCSNFPVDFAEQKTNDKSGLSIGYISIETAQAALARAQFIRPSSHLASLRAWGDRVKLPPGSSIKLDAEALSAQRQLQLKLLIARGKEQGYLTYAEVNDHLPSEIVDPEQIEDIVNMINDMGIRVYEHAPAGGVPEPEATVTSKKVDESIWAAALWEYESTERRPGLYARLFAELDGDEAKTKAAYIKERFNQLKSERRS